MAQPAGPEYGADRPLEGLRDGAGRPPEGLRDRKKRLTRQAISDAATTMFLERGFDAVRVAEIAAVSGVSEKTVYNYFPTKESLLLDREDAIGDAIRTALGQRAATRSLVAAALEVLDRDLAELAAHWKGEEGPGLATLQRFAGLIDDTPSLRGAHQDMMSRLVQVAAAALAERAGVSPDDPEPQMAANAVLGLWHVQFGALRRHARSGLPLHEVLATTSAEVRRAARLIDSGLWAFSALVEGADSRDTLLAAAEAATQGARQVASSVRRAKELWRQLQRADAHETGGARPSSEVEQLAAARPHPGRPHPGRPHPGRPHPGRA